MALTATQQQDIYKLAIGMYNASPGVTYMNELGGYMTAGLTTQQLFQVLASSSSFQNQSFAYSAASTNSQFATAFVNNLVGNTLTDANKSWAVDWVTSQLNAGASRGNVMYTAVTALAAVPTTDANFGAARVQLDNKVSVAQYYTETLNGNATALSTLQGTVATVTNDPATVTAANQANLQTAGTTHSLTTGADNLVGGSGNDSFSGGLGSLSTIDEVHGGAGTDALTVTFAPELATAGAGTAAAPIISAVEILNITSRSNSAQLDFTDIKGVTAVNVNGNNNLKLVNMQSDLTAVSVNGMTGQLTIDIQTATASTAAFGLTLNLSGATALDVIWADDTGSTALNDTLTVNALGNVQNASSATSFAGVEKLVLKGQGAVSLNMASGVAGGMSADAFADLTANNTGVGIDASGLSGNLTLRLDAGDMSVVGGAGADTFNYTAGFNTQDTLDGGAGADTLNMIHTGGYIRPIVSGVETLNMLVNSTAATADFRDVNAVTGLNLMLGTGLVVDRAATSMTTITVNSSDSTANALQVNFGTAAVASDVTLNLGNGAMNSIIGQTAAATASGMGIGTITMSGNSGSLTIVTNSTAKYSAAAVELNDFTAVTVNVASANFVVDSAMDVNTAQTLALNAAAGRTLTIGDDLSAQGVRSFTVSAGQSAVVTFAETAAINGTAGTVTLVGGASAVIDFSAVQFCGADTINLSIGASGTITADTIALGQEGATAGSGAVTLNTLNISAAGDVAIAAMGVNTATVHTAVQLAVNVVLTNTAASVGISGVALSDVGSAATASEQDVTFNVSGTGAFVLSAAATDSSNVTWHINASAMASGGSVTINLSNLNDTGTTVSAVFGAATGNYIGADGVDRIEVGLGAVTVDGGLGNDQITFGNTAANNAHVTINTVAGVDTVVGASTNDVILFGAANTATAEAYLGSAWNTGTATTTAQIRTSSFSGQATAAGVTAIQQLAIYTAGGDIIIEVLGTTATVSANTGGAVLTASDDFARVVLSNRDLTAAITAMFQVNTTGTGLSVTLLS